MEPQQIEDQPCDGDVHINSIGRLEVYQDGLWYEVCSGIARQPEGWE